MSRIYDTIEGVSYNRNIFYCFFQKYQIWEKIYNNVIASQREALGLQSLGPMDIHLLVAQDKQSRGDISDTYREFEQVFAFRDGNHQNCFKDETCTYCNKNGHTETMCFTKHDNDKLTKMAQNVSAAMAEQITATNKQAMESILETHSKMNLKG